MTYLYVLMSASLCTMGIVLLRFNSRDLFTRLIGILLIIASCGSLGVSIRITIIPTLYDYLTWPHITFMLMSISLAALYIYFFTLPYFILVAALFFSDTITGRLRLLVIVLSAAAPVISIVYQILHYPLADLHLITNRYWTPFYNLASIILYLIGVFKEPSPFIKRSKTRIAGVFCTAVAWVAVTDFWDIYRIEARFDRVFHLFSSGLWKYNLIIIAWLVIFFSYYGLRYGFLGIKLRIEKERFDYSMRTLTAGTSILNHSLSNEIHKIDYLTEQARDAVQSGHNNIAFQSMEGLHQVTEHMLGMIGRIKEKSDDFAVREQPVALQQLVVKTLHELQPLLQQKHIELRMTFSRSIVLNCDEVHVREVIHNLTKNAIESMHGEGGWIEWSIQAARRNVFLIIRDNGCGIENSDLPKVLQPFYTTKSNPEHYGLGLSYCSSVMYKHGGSLEIVSKPGRGTTVILKFPYKSVVTTLQNRGSSSARQAATAADAVRPYS